MAKRPVALWFGVGSLEGIEEATRATAGALGPYIEEHGVGSMSCFAVPVVVRSAGDDQLFAVALIGNDLPVAAEVQVRRALTHIAVEVHDVPPGLWEHARQGANGAIDAMVPSGTGVHSSDPAEFARILRGERRTAS